MTPSPAPLQREIEQLRDENARLRDQVTVLKCDAAAMRELLKREGGRCSGM